MEGTPTNQLLLRTNEPLEGHELRQWVENMGEVLFLKAYPELNRAVVVFSTIKEAMAAKGVLSEKGGFEVHYGRGADREQVLSFHLSLPPQEKMFLLSPPPSPPEGWKPLYEGINSIPHFNVDLELKLNNVLLEGDQSRGMPTITVDDCNESQPQNEDDRTTRSGEWGGGGDGAVFSMDQ